MVKFEFLITTLSMNQFFKERSFIFLYIRLLCQHIANTLTHILLYHVTGPTKIGDVGTNYKIIFNESCI